MEPTQNDEEQILQQQLDETKEQLRRSVVLNKELKIERERLMLENYTLIRQNSQLKNQLNEVKSHAVTVTQVASNFQRVVNGLLPDFHEQHEKAQGHAKPIVQVTPKPAVQMAKVPVSAVPANVQRPTIVEMSPGQMLQIKQKGNIHGQLVDSVGDIVFKKTTPVVVGATKMDSLDPKATAKNLSPVAEPIAKNSTSIEPIANHSASIAEPIAKKTESAAESAANKIMQFFDSASKKDAPAVKKTVHFLEPVVNVIPVDEPMDKKPMVKETAVNQNTFKKPMTKGSMAKTAVPVPDSTVQKTTPIVEAIKTIVPLFESAAKKTESVTEASMKKAAPDVGTVVKKAVPIVATPEMTALTGGNAPRKLATPTVDTIEPVFDLSHPVDVTPTGSNENLVNYVSKSLTPIVMLERTNLDILMTNKPVSNTDTKLEASPMSRGEKRRLTTNLSEEGTKQVRITRSKAKSDKDETPVRRPTQKQPAVGAKKKAESKPKIVPSTTRSTPTVTVKKDVKLDKNFGDRSHSEPTKPVSIKTDSNDTARTAVYRLGTKKIAKRRDTLLI